MQLVGVCSGIGGFELAAEWAGWRVAGMCEIDPYARSVLARHWPGVPIHDDLWTLTPGIIRGWLGPGPWTLTGGIPCQPFSLAGKQLGQQDPRHLWPAVAALIDGLGSDKPDWVVLENVRGFVRLAIDDLLTDLENLGYATRQAVVPAAGVGALHRRERVWIIGHRTDRDAGADAPA